MDFGDDYLPDDWSGEEMDFDYLNELYSYEEYEDDDYAE